jgi:hypothetical protein
MGLMHRLLSAAAFVVFATVPTWADTPPPAAEASATWECPQADGSSIYTNKERAGCRAMMLRPLSVVPSLENMPTIPRTMTAAAPHYDGAPYQDRAPGTGGRNVPDWARDWYANNTSSGSVHAEVCGMYMEYLQLAQKTRGGFWFGSDPSYGGDLSGRNQRGPSYSFYDNARWMALSRMFGTGFVPVGCQ